MIHIFKSEAVEIKHSVCVLKSKKPITDGDTIAIEKENTQAVYGVAEIIESNGLKQDWYILLLRPLE